MKAAEVTSRLNKIFGLRLSANTLYQLGCAIDVAAEVDRLIQGQDCGRISNRKANEADVIWQVGNT